jgi:hypothetical protein
VEAQVDDSVTANAEERKCRDCMRTFPTDPATSRSYWYPRKTKRMVLARTFDDGSELWERHEFLAFPSYCKQCQNRRDAMSRRVERELAKVPEDERPEVRASLGGPCACCGEMDPRHRRVPAKRFGQWPLLCPTCWDNCQRATWDVGMARDVWIPLFKHIGRERSLDAQWTATYGGKRLAHGRYPDETTGGATWRRATRDDLDGLPTSHVACIHAERAWRRVMNWLAATIPASPPKQ